MAASWIKVEVTTPDKDEVGRIAEILGIEDPDTVVGKLVRLWAWIDTYANDCNALTVTKRFLDQRVYCPGFMDAMEQVGWLEVVDGKLSLVNGSRHNGEPAKVRAQTNKRVNAYREREKEKERLAAEQAKRSCNAGGVTETTGFLLQGTLPKPLPESELEFNSKKERERNNTVVIEVTAEDVAAMSQDPSFGVWCGVMCSLRPAWTNGALNHFEIREAIKAYRGVSLGNEDVQLLGAYFASSLPDDRNGTRFYRPDSREKLFMRLPDVLVNAQRWKKETNWKPKKK